MDVNNPLVQEAVQQKFNPDITITVNEEGRLLLNHSERFTLLEILGLLQMASNTVIGSMSR